jgi:hypothetical protein
MKKLRVHLKERRNFGGVFFALKIGTWDCRNCLRLMGVLLGLEKIWLVIFLIAS